MIPKFSLFVAFALLTACQFNHVCGQSRSRSEVFGDVVEYFETLTGGVFKVQTSWPADVRESLEGIASQLRAWKDTRDDSMAAASSMQQPSFLMHR